LYLILHTSQANQQADQGQANVIAELRGQMALMQEANQGLRGQMALMQEANQGLRGQMALMQGQLNNLVSFSNNPS
jgi:hypothetical protein